MYDSSDLLDFSLAAPPAGASYPDAPNKDLLLLAVRNEIIGQAGLVAATTSILNALESDRTDIASEEALLVYLPADLSLVPVLMPRLVAANVPAGIICGVQDLVSRISHGRRAAKAYARCPAQLDFKGGVHIDVLTGTWRNTCRQTLMVLQTIEKYCAAIDTLTNLSVERIASLLKQAASGDSPCLKGDGSVDIPGLTERRSQRRYKVRWPAVARFNHVALDVDVTDISLGGIGMECDLVPSVGASGFVAFECGKQVHGCVAWTNKARFGFRFDAALPSGDILIQLARKDSRRQND